MKIESLILSILNQLHNASAMCENDRLQKLKCDYKYDSFFVKIQR